MYNLSILHAEVGNINTGSNPCYLTYPLSDEGIGAGGAHTSDSYRYRLKTRGKPTYWPVGRCTKSSIVYRNDWVIVIKLWHPSRSSTVNFIKPLNDHGSNKLAYAVFTAPGHQRRLKEIS